MIQDVPIFIVGSVVFWVAMSGVLAIIYKKIN